MIIIISSNLNVLQRVWRQMLYDHLLLIIVKFSYIILINIFFIFQLMKYQNVRGGRIVLQDVKGPAVEWKCHITALEDALALERKVNESLLAIHVTAGSHNDAHLSDFLEENFLDEQVESINEISKLITNAKRCGDGLGIYQFDKLTMQA